MAGTFAGKAALVTGASSGIGHAVARKLAAEGAAVALVARRADLLERLANEINAAGGKAVALPADAREPEAIKQAVARAVEALGTLDVLVTSAGQSTSGDLRRVSDETLETAVRTKLLGTVRFARDAAPHMRRGGVMVLIVGGAGKQPAPTNVVNALSNAALLAFTTAFADALAADGIRVVAVNPGPTNTAVLDRLVTVVMERDGLERPAALERLRKETPQGRIPEPEDIAELVAFLASDAASWISGTSIDFGGRGRAL